MTSPIKAGDQVFIPEFMEFTNELIIPKKTHKSIDFIPEHLLLKINKDIKVAKELCLMFLSYITITVFDNVKDGVYHTEGRPLLASKLAWFLRSPKSTAGDNNVYFHIIEALKVGTPEKGPMIIVDDKYMPNALCRKYNLTGTYKHGIQKYKLTTKFVKDIKLRNMREMMAKAYTNVIGANQIRLYSYLDMPTSAQLLERGKELCKDGYHTKKGKKLTMMYRKDKSYWKDADKRSFVEQDIEIYEYLTAYGFMIPIIGDDNCPRVYDALSLLPSWIRKEIKFDGKPMFEADYKCLHPNLIMKIYKGSTKYITHQAVADTLGLDVSIVKTEHLSFFNRKVQDIVKRDLYTYYNQIEAVVMEKVLQDKRSQKDHKITSKLLFTLEVELMTAVIKQLNEEGIFVGYIYDALFTTEQWMPRVIEVMNQKVMEFGIYTTASTDIEIAQSETSEPVVDILTKEDYVEYLREHFMSSLSDRRFKENETRIYTALVESQVRRKSEIKETIKQLIK